MHRGTAFNVRNYGLGITYVFFMLATQHAISAWTENTSPSCDPGYPQAICDVLARMAEQRQLQETIQASVFAVVGAITLAMVIAAWRHFLQAETSWPGGDPKPKETIHSSAELTPNDRAEAVHRIFVRSPMFQGALWIFVLVVAGLLVAWLVPALRPEPPLDTVALMFAIIGGGASFGLVLGWGLAVVFARSGAGSKRRSFLYTFAPNGFSVKFPMIKRNPIIHFPWTSRMSAVETENLFIVRHWLMIPGGFIIVPKRDLAPSGDAYRLRQMLHSKLGSRAHMPGGGVPPPSFGAS